MSRASTIYASAYATERTHEVRMRKGEQRTITVDMNGAIPQGVTIASVAWDSSFQSVVSIGNQGSSDRNFTATFTGLDFGSGDLEAAVSLSDGSVSIQRLFAMIS